MITLVLSEMLIVIFASIYLDKHSISSECFGKPQIFKWNY